MKLCVTRTIVPASRIPMALGNTMLTSFCPDRVQLEPELDEEKLLFALLLTIGLLSSTSALLLEK
jgi:hypothetical protein